MMNLLVDIGRRSEFETEFYKITCTEETYNRCDIFQRVVYNVQYLYDDKYSKNGNLCLCNGFAGIFFTLRSFYFPVDEVEVFYNCENVNLPLVIGVYSVDARKYYKYQRLKKIKVAVNIMPIEDATEDGLFELLINENNEYNKKLTLKVSGKLETLNVNETEIQFGSFRKIVYTPQHSTTEKSILYANFLFDLRENPDSQTVAFKNIINEEFDRVTALCACIEEVRVYLIIVLEKNCEFLFYERRESGDETYWIPVKLNDEDLKEKRLMERLESVFGQNTARATIPPFKVETVTKPSTEVPEDFTERPTTAHTNEYSTPELSYRNTGRPSYERTTSEPNYKYTPEPVYQSTTIRSYPYAHTEETVHHTGSFQSHYDFEDEYQSIVESHSLWHANPWLKFTAFILGIGILGLVFGVVLAYILYVMYGNHGEGYKRV